MRRVFCLALRIAALLALPTATALAQGPTPPTPPSLPSISITGAPESMSVPLQIVLLLTLLTVLPAALASLTPFLRILIVLHFLRQAIGTQTAPGNQTLLGLALFLTIVVMQPTADRVYREAIEPMQNGDISQMEALEVGPRAVAHPLGAVRPRERGGSVS